MSERRLLFQHPLREVEELCGTRETASRTVAGRLELAWLLHYDFLSICVFAQPLLTFVSIAIGHAHLNNPNTLLAFILPFPTLELR